MGGKLFIQPLFKDMNSPPQAQVGQLLALTCGHNGRPTDIESLQLADHLERAGFIVQDDAESSVGRDYQSSSIDNIPVK